MWDVAIIGAGLAGLTCGRQLQAAGYQVCVIDKSRGLGGRMATRRVGDRLRLDHGLRYWQPQTAALQPLTEELINAGVLRLWPVSAYEIRQREVLEPVEHEPMYAAHEGMSAIAKYLARSFTPGENLLTHHRATTLTNHRDHWQIHTENGEIVTARRCIITIPAPQAADLLGACPLETLDHRPELPSALAHLRAVTYFPCLTVLAGYGSRDRAAMSQLLNPQGWMVTDTVGTSTAWIGLDSSKRSSAQTPVDEAFTLVIHSKPAFAERYLNSSDLQPAASVLLRANARKLGEWVAQPEWFQIHRWRYAQVAQPHPAALLAISPELLCGGDWCSPPAPENEPASSNEPGSKPAVTPIDAAYAAGLALARTLQTQTRL